MRLGELQALTLSDIDFTENKIHITKTLQQNTHVIGTTKTENGIRTVTMPAAIMEELKDYISRLYDIQPEERLFPYSRSLIYSTYGHLYPTKHQEVADKLNSLLS